MICSAFLCVCARLYVVRYSVVCLLIGLFDFTSLSQSTKLLLSLFVCFLSFQCNRYLVLVAADTSLTPTSIMKTGWEKERKKIIKNLTRKQMNERNVHWMTQFVQSNFLYMCRPIILFESCKQIDYWIMHAGEKMEWTTRITTALKHTQLTVRKRKMLE